MPGRLRVALPIALFVALLMVSSAGAFTRSGTTERISRTYDGSTVDGSSAHPKLSADGRMVVFTSTASNIVPNDMNNQEDVFVHDRETGETRFVATLPDGTPPRFRTLEGSISADGRFVVFYSLGRMRPEDPGTGLVYLKDLHTGALELISIADDESPPNGPSFMNNTMSVISEDNRYVAFMSRATNLVPGFTPDIVGYHIYVRDRVEGRTELVSIGSDGEPSAENNQTPAISADGRIVAWETRALLTPHDTGGVMSVYARDRVGETTELISVGWNGESANDNAWRPKLSADGRFVAFETTAWNLVPRDIISCCQSDIFVRDRQLGHTERISVTSAGEQINGSAARMSISGDGRYIAFWSDAPNMVVGGKPAIPDVYVRDIVTGQTELVSIATDGGFGDNSSQVPSISADGRTVAWFGWATNLTADHDGTGFQHAYVRERGPTLGSYEVDVTAHPDNVEVIGSAAFAGDVAAEADDPAGDAGPGALELGADLTGASLSWSPEDGGLLARWRVTNIPTVDVPTLVYGMRLTAAGHHYEIRAQGVQVPNTSVNGVFGLYECEPACIRIAELRGGYGTVGAEVQVAVPIEILGAPGSVSALEAYTAQVPGEGSAVLAHDTVGLPDASLPTPEVRIGIAPVGVEPETTTSVALSAGRFTASVDTNGLAPGAYEIVVSSCLGGCVVNHYPLTLGPKDPVTAITELAFTAGHAPTGQYSDEVRFEARLSASSDEPLAGHELNFKLVGAESTRTFTATTDDAGIAAVTPTLEEIPGPYQLTVRFAGTDAYEASVDTTIFIVDKEDSDTELTVEGKGNKRSLTARLSDHDMPLEGIASRTIDFYADSELIGSVTTDDNGVATLNPPPRFRGGKHDFEVRYEGDDYYRPSSASIQS